MVRICFVSADRLFALGGLLPALLGAWRTTVAAGHRSGGRVLHPRLPALPPSAEPRPPGRDPERWMSAPARTVQLVDFGGRMLVEPFLFIGLIVVVRRVLVPIAEAEAEGGRRAENIGFLVQIGALGGLALALALAIHLLRGSEPDAEDDVGP